MLRKVIYIIAILVFLPAAGFKSESFKLENGMDVVVIPNSKMPVISSMVWYKIGSIDEEQGKSGLAHFLEHLMFKGTAKYGNGEFSKLIARSGGNDNAFTSTDYTAYFQNISKDKLELVLDLESDRMQNLLFDENETMKERNVILEERSMRIDNDPSSLMREQMNASLFLNHPYGRPLIGWRHEMEQLTTEDARKWYLNYYVPSNAILIVSGDITAAELKPLAEKYFGKIRPGEPHIRKKITEPNHIAARRVYLKDDKVEQPEFSRYYLAPSQNTDGKEYCYALVILSKILGEESTSRLYKKLVMENKTAASISSSYDDLQSGPAVFAISAIPTEKTSLDLLEAQINSEIFNIVQKGITEKELQRTKKSIIADTIYAREDLKTLAYIYGQAMASGLGTDYVEKWEENIRAVKLQDVNNASKFIFKDEKSVTGILEKTNEKNK